MATWDEILAAQESLLPDVQKQVEARRQVEVDALDKQRAYQVGLLKKQLEDAAQQAYITRMMEQRDTPAYLAQQGLGGGYTETAAGNIFRNYRNSINSANKVYSDNTNNLENTYATNLSGINTTYSQMLMDAMAQRRAEALQRAVLAAQYGGLTPSNGSIISTGDSGGSGEDDKKTVVTYGTPSLAGAQGYQTPYTGTKIKSTSDIMADRNRSARINYAYNRTPSKSSVSGKYF